jgi:hypothetical protein
MSIAKARRLFSRFKSYSRTEMATVNLCHEARASLAPRVLAIQTGISTVSNRPNADSVSGASRKFSKSNKKGPCGPFVDEGTGALTASAP